MNGSNSTLLGYLMGGIMPKNMHNDEFIVHIKDLLDPFGDVTLRFMFGGYSIYKSGVIFGLIADQELYFKANADAAKFFQASGSEQFSYESRGKKIKMCYWKVTAEALESQELLRKWFDAAYDSALKQVTKRKKKITD